MKQSTSLEEERRALLEQIHASRETYRRMLTKSGSRNNDIIDVDIVDAGRPHRFPRSMTMRWLTRHPYMSAAVVVGVALLGARSAKTAIMHRTGRQGHMSRHNVAYRRPTPSVDVSAPRRTARTRSTDFPSSGASRPAAIARSAITSLVTIGAMLMRDPAKMQAASRAFEAASRFVRSRRAQHADNRHVEIVRTKQG
jgi:hypothetical protein